MKTLFSPFLIFLFATSAMACPSALQQNPAQAVAQTPAPETTLREILDHPKKYKDLPVTLTGQFFGWKEACPDSMLKTRSDWVLKADNHCIYVSGKMPPRGLSLTRPKGEKVAVTGYLKLMKKNWPVFEAASVQLLP